MLLQLLFDRSTLLRGNGGLVSLDVLDFAHGSLTCSQSSWALSGGFLCGGPATRLPVLRFFASRELGEQGR